MPLVRGPFPVARPEPDESVGRARFPPRTWPMHYGRVPPRCPRAAINSQRPPPAAPCELEASARFEAASNARDTLVMRRSPVILATARRAISVPLAPGAGGTSRALTAKPPASSAPASRPITAICKQVLAPYNRGVAAVTRPVTKTRLPALGYLRRSETASRLSPLVDGYAVLRV